VISLKKHLKSTISSLRSLIEKTNFFCTFYCKILPYTTRRTYAKSFKKVDRLDCEIIMFEVERKVSITCVLQGQQSLTTIGVKILNYATLSFCTISMHIMLNTCVPNLRGRG
jgi:hypothetical protein